MPPVLAPEPKPAPETVVQKQPDPAPKKRGTAKANASKLLPKPLRNPKTHPELLADEAPSLKPGKFIPVIRQNTSDPVSPRCVSTRNWINLSEGPAYEEEYDKLLRHLHEAPKLRKPPVGPNPYAKDDLAGKASLVRRERRRTDFASALFTPEATYDFALQIMQDGDQVTWRRLLRAAVDRAAE
jgi:hypothetical protein